VVEKIDGESIWSWSFAFYYLVYNILNHLDGDQIHQSIIVLVGDERRDVVDDLIYGCLSIGVVFREKVFVERD
jgi:hypothetical protein